MEKNCDSPVKGFSYVNPNVQDMRRSSVKSECQTQLSQEERFSEGDVSILSESILEWKESRIYNFKKPRINEKTDTNQMLEGQSKSLVVSRIVNENVREGGVGYINQINQLESIEKKTEKLVIKEREQRKEIKRLKKMLLQQQNRSNQTITQINDYSSRMQHQIDVMEEKQSQFLREKQKIQQQLYETQLLVKRTEEQLLTIKRQKQCLLRRIERLQANCQAELEKRTYSKPHNGVYETRFDQIINEVDELGEIDREIQIIDQQIERVKTNKVDNKWERVIGLFELRRNYSKKKEEVQMCKQRKMYEKIIFRLNYLLKKRQQQGGQITRLQKKDEYCNQAAFFMEKQQIQCETSDSFFNAFNTNASQVEPAEHQQKKCIITLESQCEEISQLIQLFKINNYEDVYHSIEYLTFGLLQLATNRDIYEKCLPVIAKSMKIINADLVGKAEKQYSRIQKLKRVMNQQFIQKKI